MAPRLFQLLNNNQKLCPWKICDDHSRIKFSKVPAMREIIEQKGRSFDSNVFVRHRAIAVTMLSFIRYPSPCAFFANWQPLVLMFWTNETTVSKEQQKIHAKWGFVFYKKKEKKKTPSTWIRADSLECCDFADATLPPNERSLSLALARTLSENTQLI